MFGVLPGCSVFSLEAEIFTGEIFMGERGIFLLPNVVCSSSSVAANVG